MGFPLPRAGTGYDDDMSDTKPGPASPQDVGADAPTPPGGPQRQDGAGSVPAGDLGAGEQAPDSVEDSHGGTIPIEGEQPDPDTGSEETAEQRGNAEASTEQPSQ